MYLYKNLEKKMLSGLCLGGCYGVITIRPAGGKGWPICRLGSGHPQGVIGVFLVTHLIQIVLNFLSLWLF
jgi:hypothetical protein